MSIFRFIVFSVLGISYGSLCYADPANVLYEYDEEHRISDFLTDDFFIKTPTVLSVKYEKIFSEQYLFIDSEHSNRGKIDLFRVFDYKAGSVKKPEHVTTLHPPFYPPKYDIISNAACSLLVAGKCLLRFNEATRTYEIYKLTYAGEGQAVYNFKFSKPIELEADFPIHKLYVGANYLIDGGDYMTPPSVVKIQNGRLIKLHDLEIHHYDFGSDFKITTNSPYNNHTALVTPNGSAYIFRSIGTEHFQKRAEVVFWKPAFSNIGGIAFSNVRDPLAPDLLTVTLPDSIDPYRSQQITIMSGAGHVYSKYSVRTLMRNVDPSYIDVVVGSFSDLQVRGNKIIIPIPENVLYYMSQG